MVGYHRNPVMSPRNPQKNFDNFPPLWSGIEKSLWVVLLIPLGIDPYEWGVHFMIPLGYHDLRWPYVLTAILFFSLLVGVVFRLGPSGRLWWAPLRNPIFWLAIALCLCGFIGATHGVYPKRSLLMLAWTAGTVFGLGWVVDGLWARHGKFLFWTMAVILALHMTVLLFDGIFGNLTQGRIHIGFTRPYAGQVRPSAFRQEPGYYAAWMLTASVLIRAVIFYLPQYTSRHGKWVLWTLWFTALGTSALSTSRMGLGGALILLSLEWILGLWSFIKQGAKPRNRFLLFLIPVFLGIGFLTFLAKSPANGLPGYLRAGVFQPHKDPSGQIRWETVTKAVSLFTKNPWFGTGPGVAGAEAVARGMIPDNLPGSTSPPPAESPLSNNLYTEVLSEWGAVGTLLWLVFGVLLLAPMPWGLRLRWLAALGLIYLTSETLPRFDLWLNILCCVSLCRNPENLGQAHPGAPDQ